MRRLRPAAPSPSSSALVLGGCVLAAGAALSGCRATGDGGALAHVAEVVKSGEAAVLVRTLPPPAPSGSLAVVVTGKDGKVELRIAEPGGSGLVVVHTSRPGDEFRNLSVEDVTGDDAPEVVTSWIGGQLEVVEVLGRASGTWTSLLMNGGQEVETRRRPDHTTAFWVTSRTYEEGAGQPPVYQTTIYSWDGKQFREEGAGG